MAEISMDQSTDEFPTNWGRWGDNDELGAVNLITAQARARGAAEARTGRSVSLAQEARPAPLVGGPMARMTADTTGVQTAMLFTGSPPAAMAELMIINTHHPEITHLDAMGHFVTDGHVYPGVAQEKSSGMTGVRHGATHVYADGILTRGVLLDLAPHGRLEKSHAVTAADLDAAATREGIEMQSGDALVIHAGWHSATDFGQGMPGMTVSAVRWMHDHEIAIYAGDIGDAHPPIEGEFPGALHRLGLARLGIPLIDAASTKALATTCAELGRYTFLFVAAAPRIAGTTGLPVNPLAIF